jgi:hypothetical protein
VLDYANGLINATWYRDYPFKEIKKALSGCDTCNEDIEYILMLRSITFDSLEKAESS